MTKESIITKISNPTSKGGEYFLRFYENHTELFRTFRELNQNGETDTSSGSEFQILGRKVEGLLFQLEGILTSRQMGGKSTDKTVTAFYDMVESYFPMYGKIE